MDLVEIFKALGDRNRLRILNLLMRTQLCVCEMEAILGMTQSNVSRHLDKLKSVGIITSEKNAQWVFYKINESFIVENSALYEFLNERLNQDKQCIKDVEMLERYKNSDLSCRYLCRERGDSYGKDMVSNNRL